MAKASIYRGNLSAAVAEGTRLLQHNEALGALLDQLGAPTLSAAVLAEIDAEIDGRAQPKRGKRR